MTEENVVEYVHEYRTLAIWSGTVEDELCLFEIDTPTLKKVAV